MASATIDMWNIPPNVSPPYDTRAKELGFEFSDVFISSATDTYRLLNVTKIPDVYPEWIIVSEAQP